MKPFLTITTPHKDVLQGTPTFDTFAADLWEVFKKKAPDEYCDADIFFQKTYLTDGLKNLFDTTEKRLKGKGGDAVIQLQTPFGGGKTHALIALYHKAREWKAKVVVLDGTAFDPKETVLWEEIERQLTGKIEKLKGSHAPGKEKIRNLLDQVSPVLILIDELLEYETKASAIKIGDSNLASQTLSFIQELTQAISTIGNSLVILTLPASRLEHFGEESERLFIQLQKVTGRMEKIYEPVGDEEIAPVIKRRLFSSVDEKKAKQNIEEFLNYADQEKILPEGMEKSVYRERFLKSFPFQPEVIDVLYHRWGSFPKFQRTRGILRLLSLVVFSLRNSKAPFIRLSDFNLSASDIKTEFVKQIGSEYNGVISADIISHNSGSAKVNAKLGDAYAPFSFGTKTATAIFLYSFSGGAEKGASSREIKLSTADVAFPSTIISEVVSQLKENLLFLQHDSGRYFFTSEPNLNSLHLRKMENVEDGTVQEEEKNLLRQNIQDEFFQIFLYPKNPKEIPDSKELKLVILGQNDQSKCGEFLSQYGQQPRVYQNSLIFLCPKEKERPIFERAIRDCTAWEFIERDEISTLNEQQRKEVKESLRKKRGDLAENLRNLYRIVYLPTKGGVKEVDLGLVTFGKNISLDKEIYQRLKNEGELLEKLAHLILKERYLKGNDSVETKNIYESFYKTPGEMRVIKDIVLKDAIREGVKQGLFGVGEVKNGVPECRYFKDDFIAELCEGEVLIREEICKQQKKIAESPGENGTPAERFVKKEPKEIPATKQYTGIKLKFSVPSGRMADIAQIIPYLKTIFGSVELNITLSAKDGTIPVADYEDKIKEALSQANIELEEEKVE